MNEAPKKVFKIRSAKAPRIPRDEELNARAKLFEYHHKPSPITLPKVEMKKVEW